MRPIPFVKVVGTGNDFILVDSRRSSLGRNASDYARRWCDRKRGIGADGLLVIGSSRTADARMQIFNADGSEAEMCGNGLRCVAWYLHTSKNGSRTKKSLTVETGAGICPVEVVGFERTKIFLLQISDLQLNRSVIVKGRGISLCSVNTGVPHAVIETNNLKRCDVEGIGPFIRRHRLFKPQGTNVNWMRIHSKNRISMRTYERGVEAETLACGTGAVACVMVGTALGKLSPPVDVMTAGREILKIGFRNGRNFDAGAFLEGPARILFKGSIS